MPAIQRESAGTARSTDRGGGGKTEFLALRLGREEYGIDILCVQEIRSFEQVTPLPRAPGTVLGVTNLRGVIVPILDLRAQLGLEAGFDAQTVTIVLNVAGRTVGVVVDAVSDVVALSEQEIRPAPEFRGAPEVASIQGLGTLETDGRHRMLILLDIEPLVAGTLAGLPSSVAEVEAGERRSEAGERRSEAGCAL